MGAGAGVVVGGGWDVLVWVSWFSWGVVVGWVDIWCDTYGFSAVHCLVMVMGCPCFGLTGFVMDGFNESRRKQREVVV